MATVSCGTLDPYRDIQENLDSSIEAFNNEFESKAVGSSARFVHPTHRSKYLEQSLEVAKRLTIFEAAILDLKFFKDKVPAVITSKDPEEGFNRTIVTIRYQIAVLPSTKVKTLLFEQEWVLYQKQWVVILDLSKLLE